MPDVDAAVHWYESVLGLRALSPPYLLEGPAIEQDMGELLPAPVAVKAAIMGFEDGDRVLEVIEYPNVPPSEPVSARAVVDVGISHVGLLCDDIEETRRQLEEHGVELIVSGIADVAGLRTTWFRDPWGIVFILLEKRHPDRPYYKQY